MNGMFPDWIGPSSEYRTNSLLPDWINFGGTVPDFPTTPWLGGALVLPPTYGLAMVAATFGRLVSNILPSSLSVHSKVDVYTKGDPGAEVTDEDAGL